MKFFTLVALLGSASAFHLRHHMAKTKELPSFEEAKPEIVAELERDGSITKAELKAGLE